MRRYARVWWAFVRSCIVREMGFRASFLMGVVRSGFYLALALVNIEILFSYTDSLAGWSKPQMWLLLGVASLADSIQAFAIRPNMERISGYLIYGDMDFILLRPISAQFTTTLRYINVYQIPQMFINVGLIAYALDNMGWTPALGHVVIFCLMFLTGLMILYSLRLVISTLSFWLIRQAPNIGELFGILFEASRYPKRIFPDFLQFVLTFIVPLAFVTIFPAQALSGGIGVAYPLGSVALAALALYLSHRFWAFATRYYTSASS